VESSVTLPGSSCGSASLGLGSSASGMILFTRIEELKERTLLAMGLDAAEALAMTQLAGDCARRGVRMARRRAAPLNRAAGLMLNLVLLVCQWKVLLMRRSDAALGVGLDSFRLDHRSAPLLPAHLHAMQRARPRQQPQRHNDQRRARLQQCWPAPLDQVLYAAGTYNTTA
jgi:hypothetical protein